MQAFLISDEKGSGVLKFDEFQMCMRSAGLQMADSDCRFVCVRLYMSMYVCIYTYIHTYIC
jgi:hypothetical protein